jgi:chemotaxis protein MotB
MLRKTAVLAWVTLWLLVAVSCVSKSKYVELESDLSAARNEAVQDRDQLEAQQAKYKQLEDSYLALEAQREALEADKLALTGRLEQLSQQLQDRTTALQQKDLMLREMAETRQRIETGLKQQIEAQEIKIEEMAGKLKVTFVDKILFDSGSSRINERGKESLANFADSFKETRNQTIVVEGHTDDVPVGAALKARFPTNWELSTARATAVVRFLSEEAGIPAEKFSAVGYSYYRPVAANETEDGRSQNRRIELILVPIDSPAPAAAQN